MAEFKLSSAFLSEVNAFSNAGIMLNDGYCTLDKGALDLSTAERYIEQHRQIKELLDAYIELLKKDESDLEKMHDAVQNMDEELAVKYNI